MKKNKALVPYVEPGDDPKAPVVNGKKLPYVIIRGKDAGVHAGYLEEFLPESKSVRLRRSRRIWGWVGAMTLSELAVFGPSEPEKCKFAYELEDIWIVGDVCEVIYVTERGRKIIQGVPEWKA